MKKFPLDKRYEIVDADGDKYFIEEDEYIRHSDNGKPAFRIEDDEVYAYGRPTEIVGHIVGKEVVSQEGEIILQFID